jgi:DNA-binding response OmpR family regulator/uncharacterized protein YegP (UPF0339 family)
MDFVFYRDVFGAWRWEVRAADGQMHDGQNGYETREDCVEAAHLASQSGVIPAATPASAVEPVVLCVQADAALRGSLQQALVGYRAILAPNSLEAIRLMTSTLIDAYVLDYQLPGSSGIHLCRHIRRSDPHTPICFYAESGAEEQRRRALHAGAGAYVRASAGPQALRGELQRLLQEAELQSVRARIEEERVIQEELERRVVVAIDRTKRAREAAARAVELAARAKAYTQFTAAGGTPAIFHRTWPDTFRAVAARMEGSASPSQSPRQAAT